MLRIGLDYNILSAGLIIVSPPTPSIYHHIRVSGTESMSMHGKVLPNHKVFRGAITDTPNYREPGSFGSGFSARPRCG